MRTRVIPTPALVHEIAEQMIRLAELRAQRQAIPIPQALREVAGEMRAREETLKAIHQRNDALQMRALLDAENRISKYPTLGEGFLAFIQGTHGIRQGARDSIDLHVNAIQRKAFGSLIARLEQEGLYSDFKKNDSEFVKKVFMEMGAFAPDQPRQSVTGDDRAFRLANIVEEITSELVSRQNRAGAYIERLPGYIIRQTHDMYAIRALGRLKTGKLSKDLSFQRWKEFIMPLLDQEKTFQGADPEKWLRLVHDELYSGVFGRQHDIGDVSPISASGSLSDKVSSQRKIHFKNAEAAFQYNEALGVRNFKEAVMQDIHHRARSIALMEAFGPNPLAGFEELKIRLMQRAREMDDAAKQMDSLRTWSIQAAFEEVTGLNEVPENVTLNRLGSMIRITTQLAKMGAVTLASFADRAFLQAEMAYQGISHLQTFAKQITSFAKKSPEEKRMLRLMGVAIDGVLGNALSRYSVHSTVSGWMHTLQRWFFDLNGLNLWTDISKAAAGQLTAAHFGEHAHLKYAVLPIEIRRLLDIYDITPIEWDAIRSTAYTHGDLGAIYLTPDQFSKIPDEVISNLAPIYELAPTPENLLRIRNKLDDKYRGLLIDRSNFAVPTPGVAERKFTTWGARAGTPLGEAARMIMLFKSFPITILNKVLTREIYGRGAETFAQWILHDHRGKFNLVMLMAMGTIMGYLSGVIRDALKGRKPKPLIDEDGKINMATLNDAAIRGGTLGILGDILLADYEDQFHGFLRSTSGPIFSQLDSLAQIKSLVAEGKADKAMNKSMKLLLNNAPFINLFYIRPILDYLILWDLQEFMEPGAMERMEEGVYKKNKQEFFIHPSDVVKE